jgi:hypothetical protein
MNPLALIIIILVLVAASAVTGVVTAEADQPVSSPADQPAPAPTPNSRSPPVPAAGSVPDGEHSPIHLDPSYPPATQSISAPLHACPSGPTQHRNCTRQPTTIM